VTDETGSGRQSEALVPRYADREYEAEALAQRRAWIEARTGARLAHVGAYSIPSQELRGNIENALGAVQVPLGVAGPLLVHGEHAEGVFYVPMATTEGALVRSYERGMMALTRSGGASARLFRDENRVAPLFTFATLAAAADFVRRLPEWLPALRAQAESTTRHGRLLHVDAFPLGRRVIVSFSYATGDAHGMNMIVKATDHACRWLLSQCPAQGYQVFSGHSSEKRASGALLGGGKGKQVCAAARLPRRTARAVLGASPEDITAVWQNSVLGHLQAGALGFNAHLANGLTAIYIACGQDVANVANACVGVTHFEVVEGDLEASVTLPSLTLATVGGGTALGTAGECLAMLGCVGAGRAPRLAEIVAATLLAGELSMAAAIASGEFVLAHETYGRNPPPATGA
jgi:hydroxymethylglutaryl-CoA reductase (NADPH)